MRNRTIDWKKLFIPSDAFALLVIIAGLLIAIFLSDLAIKLIGVSIAILGGIALFMMINQRLADTVHSRPGFTSKSPEFKITVKKESGAKRQVIEDFETSFDIEKSSKDIPEETGEDEGFSVVSKSKAETKKDSLTITINKTDHVKIIEEDRARKEFGNSPSGTVRDIPTDPVKDTSRPTSENIEDKNLNTSKIEEEKKAEQNIPGQKQLDFEDDFSGMRIIGNKEIKPKITIKQEPVYSRPSISKPEEPNKSENKLDTEEKPVAGNKPVTNQPEQIKNVDQAVNKELSAAKETAEEKGVSQTQPQRERQYAAESDVKDPQLVRKEEVKPKPKQEKYKSKSSEFPVSVLTEELPVFGEDARKEFEFFLSKIMMTIRSVVPAKTAAFFLANNEKNELILESFVTDDPQIITKNRKLAKGNDVISQMVKNSKPEILTEINPSAELDLIPYYTKASGAVSFIGIPVFYEKSVIGVLCADSEIVDAYDAQTVNFFGQLTRLVAVIVQNYIDKYDLLQESRTLNAINVLHSHISKPELTINEITDSIIDTIDGIFEYTSAGICCYDEINGGWHLKSFKSIKNDDLEKELVGANIDMYNSIIGTCVRKDQLLSVIPFNEKYIRYHPDEPHLKDGYFVTAPLRTGMHTYGAIFIEGESSSNITQVDINILEKLGQHAGSVLEKMHFLEMLQSSAMIDYNTGILNTSAFYLRLSEEIERSNDSENPFTLSIFKIDYYAALDPEKYRDRMEKVLYHALGIVHKNLRPYDLIGKVDNETFGIIFINEKMEKSKIRMEKIRNEIAITALEIEGHKYNVTVSAGLSTVEQAGSLEELIANAGQMLNISSEKTNIITAFE